MILWGECECDQTFAVKIMNLIAGNQVRLPNFSFQQSQGCCFTRDAKLWHLECVYFFPSCDTSAVCVSFFSTFASSKDLLLLWQMFPFKHNPCSGVAAGVTTAQYQPISPRGSFVQTNPPGKFIFIEVIILTKNTNIAAVGKGSCISKKFGSQVAPLSSMDNSSYGVNPWVRCASGNVVKGLPWRQVNNEH